VNGVPMRVDRATRIVDARAETVYAALVDATALAQWLPPDGARGTIAQFDPRPGGAFCMTLRFAETGGGKTTADSDVVDSRFVELVEDQRVVYDVSFVSSDPDFTGTMRMTWSLAPHDGGTLVSIVAENVPFAVSKQDHAAGLASSLANLAAYVEDRTGIV
jgi:uncharacterized protein YndB with AHSA1/START domain